VAASNVISLPFPAETRERVFDAANLLWEQSGHATPPTVDQVRRLARVDMNAASSLMREWRRDLTARAAPVPVQVPEGVSAAGNAALATLWTQAQALANESLNAAQAAWDAERAQLEAMRTELATAFDAQTEELERLRSEAAAAAQAQEGALATLRTELDRAQNDLVVTTTTLSASTERLALATTERDQARQQASLALNDAASAREATAHLQGQLQALQQQLAALTRAIAGDRPAPDSAGR
jgi:DNA repair exonuclease SbcCD ATPase subunit